MTFQTPSLAQLCMPDKLYQKRRQWAEEKLLKASSSVGTMLRRNSSVVANAAKGQSLRLQLTTLGWVYVKKRLGTFSSNEGVHLKCGLDSLIVQMDKKAVAAESEVIDWGDSGSGGDTFKKHTKTLSKNVHIGLPKPAADPVKSSLINGDYLYFYYGCDGQDDRGWGCGYRTIQTMASWLCHNWFPPKENNRCPPSIPEIQQALVTMGDKPGSFLGSREWIGTFEASLVLDHFYDVPCKLVHVRGGGADLEQVAVKELHQHFEKHGSPVMMGGDRDNSSKGILGVCSGDKESYLLVVDPHYYGCQLERTELQRRGWVAWKRVSSLDQSSFYNLCMPQTAKKWQIYFKLYGIFSLLLQCKVFYWDWVNGMALKLLSNCSNIVWQEKIHYYNTGCDCAFNIMEMCLWGVCHLEVDWKGLNCYLSVSVVSTLTCFWIIQCGWPFSPVTIWSYMVKGHSTKWQRQCVVSIKHLQAMWSMLAE